MKTEPIEDFYARIVVAWGRDIDAGLLAEPTLPDPEHDPEGHDAAAIAHITAYVSRHHAARHLELSAALREHGTRGLGKRFQQRHPELPTFEDMERWAAPPTGRLLDLG